MNATYDPAAKLEIKVSEVDFLRTASGRQLLARIYQPQGAGPFPTMLDLHGGVLPALQERFAATYRAAGGVCELTVFEAASTSGSPSRDRRPTARARWSRRSSRVI